MEPNPATSKRRGFGAALTGFLAGLCAVLFVVTAIPTLLLFNVEQTLGRPDVFRAALAHVNGYARLPDLAAEQVMFQGRGPAPALPYLTRDDLALLLSNLFPPEWLQTRTGALLDQAFAALDPEAASDQSVSFVEIKERITGDAGIAAVQTMMRAWAPCNAEQLQAGGQAAAAGHFDGAPNCRPPEEMMAPLTPAIRLFLQLEAGRFGDQATLAQLVTGLSEPQTDPLQPVRRARSWARWSPLLLAVLLALVAVFSPRSPRTWLRRWGVLLLIPGVIWLALALLALPVLEATATPWASQLLGGLAPGALKVVLDLGRYLLRALLMQIGGQAWCLTLVGLALRIGAALLVREPAAPRLAPA